MEKDKITAPKPSVAPPQLNAEDMRNMAPGSNGRGAIYTCSVCGTRYANTGIGCPVCNKKKEQSR